MGDSIGQGVSGKVLPDMDAWLRQQHSRRPFETLPDRFRGNMPIDGVKRPVVPVRIADVDAQLLGITATSALLGLGH